LAALRSIKFKENKVNRRFVIRTAALFLISLLGTAAMHAQGTSAPGASASGKVGIVDVRQAIVATAEGKQASAELQSQFASRQSELEGINKQIADIRQRLSTSGEKLNPDEAARLQRQGEVLTRQLQRKQDEYQEDVNAAQADVVDRIGRKMIDVLDRYSRENGFVVVFDSSAQNSPVLYKSTQIDITQDIIRLFDQAYPVKGGTASTKSPAARPAATTPATKPAAGSTPPPTKPN
jgi:outer membrane protein